jgi:hypothetical protein
VPDRRDVERTQVMVRVEPPQGEQGASAPTGGKSPQGNGRVAIWVGAGILIGVLIGALVAWFFITSSAGDTLVPAIPGISATSTVTPDAKGNTGADDTNQKSSASDTKAPSTPEITFPSASSYWVAPENAKVEIRWDRVSDSGGVSYVLEFSQWLGGGEGWTSPKRSSKLRRLYYNRDVQGPKERFRIIAIDGAGNESDPSPYRTVIVAPSASEAASMNAGF